ncbi:hypothetical protein BDZ97DRAFT_83977 [Flammula alnicola]|nr:hypothetical protein BDZ97DRAFT_83977 [Flammula alnicola]
MLDPFSISRDLQTCQPNPSRVFVFLLIPRITSGPCTTYSSIHTRMLCNSALASFSSIRSKCYFFSDRAHVVLSLTIPGDKSIDFPVRDVQALCQFLFHPRYRLVFSTTFIMSHSTFRFSLMYATGYWSRVDGIVCKHHECLRLQVVLISEGDH